MGVQVREKRKGSGEWWLFINHDGKRTSRKVGTNKREADNLATVLAGRLAAGSLGMADLNKKKEAVRPFKYFMKQWFDMGLISTDRVMCVSVFSIDSCYFFEFRNKRIS